VEEGATVRWKQKGFVPLPEAARELAELMAMDLEVDEEENWAGWAISVRDSLGQQLFSVPVGATAR
jgi:hypothetical protein